MGRTVARTMAAAVAGCGECRGEWHSPPISGGMQELRQQGATGILPVRGAQIIDAQ